MSQNYQKAKIINASGMDNISSKLIKLIQKIMSMQMTHIINSLTNPETGEESNGSKRVLANLKPVSIW